MKHIVDFGHERKSIKNYFDANIHVQAISKTQDKHCGQLNKNKKESCYRTVFYALISNLPQHWIPKDIAKDPNYSVTRSRISSNLVPACGFPQIQLFLEVLELGLPVAELGPVVVQAELAHGQHGLPVFFN